MAATRTDQVNLDVIINGDRAGKTLSDLQQAQKALTASIRETTIGSQEYMDQMEKLQSVNSQISATRDEIKGVSAALEEGTQMATELAGAFGLTFGISKVVEFAEACIDAFTKAEETAHLLETSVNNITNEGPEGFQRLLDLANRLSETTIYSETEIQESERMLTNLGLTSDQIELLLPEITNYAHVNGIDLKTATETAANAIEGKTKALKKSGDEFVSTGTRIGDFNLLLQALSKYTFDAGNSFDTLSDKQKMQAKEMEAYEKDLGSSWGTLWGWIKDAAISSLEMITLGIKGFINDLTFHVFHIGEQAVEPVKTAAKEAQKVLEDAANKTKDYVSMNEKQISSMSIAALQDRLANIKDIHIASARDEQDLINKTIKTKQEAQKKADEKALADYKKLLEEIVKDREELALKGADSDYKEILAVQQKYDALRDKAKGHTKELLEIEQLRGQELKVVKDQIQAKADAEEQKHQEEVLKQLDAFAKKRDMHEKEIADLKAQTKKLSQKKNLQDDLNQIDLETKDKMDKLRDQEKQELDLVKDNDAQKAQIEAQYLKEREALTALSDERILQAKKANMNAELQATSQLFGALQGLTKQNSDASKALSIGQAIINTYLGASQALAQGGPIGIISGASVIATGLAEVAKIEGVQFAVGGPTGKMPSFAGGGPVSKPFLALAGEAGPEWIAPNWMLQHPQTANIISSLENIRQSKAFAAGGPTTSSSTGPVPFANNSASSDHTARMASALDKLNDHLDNGIQSVWQWDAYTKGIARANAAKNGATLATS